LVMDQGIIYYTDNRIDGTQIFRESQKTILASSLPIVSCSLKSIDFGKNIVLEGRLRSYPTMALQILTALEASTAKYVFFCEHDVLYHPSHFDFVPERNDIYYYNVNNWRWEYPKDRAISYDGLTSLSSLCCNRELAIKHYKYRLKLIADWGLDEIRSREPRWARRFGYEPGTKKRRNGGVTNEDHIKRRSKLPNVDIRHDKTFSRPKVKLDEFIHLPTDFKEMPASQIEGWDLKGLFGLWN
jgi:hypothetical protein